ncbi:MAG TPA: hypothetical protein VF803_02020 [Candidatus Paceibacterota bacterium]
MLDYESRTRELEAYRHAETLKLAAGRSPIVQRVIMENPVMTYPDHLLNDYLRTSPPVDRKKYHPPCANIILAGGGDPLVCRDDCFAACFSWCLLDVQDAYAKSRGMVCRDGADALAVEYRKWWGIVSLHGDRTDLFPPSVPIFDFWLEHSGHRVNYENFCRNAGRHGPLPVSIPAESGQLFALNTLPAYRMIYGSANFPSHLWDNASI